MLALVGTGSFAGIDVLQGLMQDSTSGGNSATLKIYICKSQLNKRITSTYQLILYSDIESSYSSKLQSADFEVRLHPAVFILAHPQPHVLGSTLNKTTRLMQPMISDLKVIKVIKPANSRNLNTYFASSGCSSLVFDYEAALCNSLSSKPK